MRRSTCCSCTRSCGVIRRAATSSRSRRHPSEAAIGSKARSHSDAGRQRLEEAAEVSCPYCGETITIVLDLLVDEQSYIEDCSVCCQPMTVSYRAGDGELAELNVEAAG